MPPSNSYLVARHAGAMWSGHPWTPHVLSKSPVASDPYTKYDVTDVPMPEVRGRMFSQRGGAWWKTTGTRPEFVGMVATGCDCKPVATGEVALVDAVKGTGLDYLAIVVGAGVGVAVANATKKPGRRSAYAGVGAIVGLFIREKMR